MNSGIYQIKNQLNNHCYIGSSQKIKNRWRQHKGLLKNNKHHSIHLQNAWNKYGSQNFIFTILEYCEIDKLLEKEQEYLIKFKPEYNIALDPKAPMRGRKHKNKEKFIGRPNGMKGKNHTKESKELMSINRSKVEMTPEVREAWIEKLKLNPPKYWLGKNISEESKKKISIYQRSLCKPFLCINNNKIYLTQLEASKELNIRQGHISEVLNGKRESAKGYKFVWVNTSLI